MTGILSPDLQVMPVRYHERNRGAGTVAKTDAHPKRGAATSRTSPTPRSLRPYPGLQMGAGTRTE
jgi:hypothetical protein